MKKNTHNYDFLKMSLIFYNKYTDNLFNFVETNLKLWDKEAYFNFNIERDNQANHKP